MEVSKMGKSVCLALGLGLLYAAPGVADQKAGADLAANAALKYWQAFSTMPKLDENFQPGDVGTMPLDAKTKELVASADYALEQMHYGAALPQRWAPAWRKTASAPGCRSARRPAI